MQPIQTSVLLVLALISTSLAAGGFGPPKENAHAEKSLGQSLAKLNPFKKSEKPPAAAPGQGSSTASSSKGIGSKIAGIFGKKKDPNPYEAIHTGTVPGHPPPTSALPPKRQEVRLPKVLPGPSGRAGSSSSRQEGSQSSRRSVSGYGHTPPESPFSQAQRTGSGLTASSGGSLSVKDLTKHRARHAAEVQAADGYREPKDAPTKVHTVPLSPYHNVEIHSHGADVPVAQPLNVMGRHEGAGNTSHIQPSTTTAERERGVSEHHYEVPMTGKTDGLLKLQDRTKTPLYEGSKDRAKVYAGKDYHRRASFGHWDPATGMMTDRVHVWRKGPDEE